MSQTVFMALIVLIIAAAAVGAAVYIYASVYVNAGPRTRRRMRLAPVYDFARGLVKPPLAAPLEAFRQGLRRRAARRTERDQQDGLWSDVVTERHGDDMVTFARGPGGGTWTVVSRERQHEHQRSLWAARQMARSAPGWAAETGPGGGPGLYADPRPAVEDSLLRNPSVRAAVGVAEVERAPEEHQGATEGWSPAAEVGLDEKPVTLTHTKLDVEALAVLAAFDAHVQDWRTAPQWLTAYGAEVDAALKAADLEGIATAQARWRQTAFDVPTGEYRRVLATAA